MTDKFEKRLPPICSFYMEKPESPVHFFHSFTKTNFLWTQLQHSFQNVLIITPIIPQSVIFGFTDHQVNYHLTHSMPLVLSVAPENIRKLQVF